MMSSLHHTTGRYCRCTGTTAVYPSADDDVITSPYNMSTGTVHVQIYNGCLSFSRWWCHHFPLQQVGTVHVQIYNGCLSFGRWWCHHFTIQHVYRYCTCTGLQRLLILQQMMMSSLRHTTARYCRCTGLYRMSIYHRWYHHFPIQQLGKYCGCTGLYRLFIYYRWYNHFPIQQLGKYCGCTSKTYMSCLSISSWCGQS